jgi:hypothetical protein
MHLYKTITQILLILSIPNLMFAAPIPIIPREIGTVPGGTVITPLQDSAPSSGSPPSSEGIGKTSATDEVPASTDASTFAHPLSAPNGAAPVSDPITNKKLSFYKTPTNVEVAKHMVGAAVIVAALIGIGELNQKLDGGNND